jgi:3-deoxy-manno-octulosonate cytidylyltransferase (CMP-KDO synthetase)
MRLAIVIPARFASTRFPGKPLHPLAGKPMIQHVWERAREAAGGADVAIATDDHRIRRAALAFGARVEMTRPEHPSGTDRIIEVMERNPEWDGVINVQGDEPLISPALIARLMGALAADASLDMVTAAVPVEDAALASDPNVVKVVTAVSGDALYFSRAPIPWDRAGGSGSPRFLWHKGLYGYRRDFLLRYRAWDPSPLEKLEQLEQLRALENGARIRVLETDDVAPGVDTPEQASEVEARMAKEK